VRVAGISLVANYRTEFDNQVREGGIEGLIKALRSKNQALERPAAAAPAEKKK
jgi:phospholipid transport system substrate-binding protein